jgi:hypothetical protein
MCEVFVECVDHRLDLAGQLVAARQHVLVFGGAPETGSVTETVVFSRDG